MAEKGKSIVLEMARVILNYEAAHRPEGLRHQQVKAHSELMALAGKIRKWSE